MQSLKSILLEDFDEVAAAHPELEVTGLLFTAGTYENAALEASLPEADLPAFYAGWVASGKLWSDALYPEIAHNSLPAVNDTGAYTNTVDP